jgi:excisionase family DNA binding protein
MSTTRVNPMPDGPRRPGHLVTQEVAARKYHSSTRTIRHWIEDGRITAYKVPGERAVRVDLDEIDEVMPSTPQMRGGRPLFGPKAKIVVLAALPIEYVDPS